MNKLIHTILNFFFPQKCIGCGKDNTLLCNDCLKRIDYPGLPKDKNIFAAADYNDETAKKAIWLLKYRKIKAISEPLAKLIYERIWNKIKIKNPIFIPIPLSKNRLKERGFNQAELIAKYLSDKTSITLITNVLYKIKDTPSQVSIKNREKRLDNLKGSFAVKNQELIKDKNIILIDDVCTTGATIREARKIIKEKGAKKILAAVVARG